MEVVERKKVVEMDLIYVKYKFFFGKIKIKDV